MQVAEKPTDSSLAELYDRDYFEHGKYVDDRAARLEQKRRIDWLREHGVPAGARVLDAGCATGDFIAAARHEFDMYGNDISEHAIGVARRRMPELADRLTATPLEQLPRSAGNYDAVVLWDVIEHVWSPRDVLATLAGHVRPGGVIAMSTPNIGAIIARTMGRRWAFMTPPEHLCFFDRRTMARLVRGAGLELAGWRSVGKSVNTGFLVYKLSRVFPDIVPASAVKWFGTTAAARAVIYVPTGDIQYVAARKPAG